MLSVSSDQSWLRKKRGRRWEGAEVYIDGGRALAYRQEHGLGVAGRGSAEVMAVVEAGGRGGRGGECGKVAFTGIF